MTTAYSTYLQGPNALFFDREIIENLKDNMFWFRMSYQYRSLWRNLRIDGFEGYIWNRQELPKYQKMEYKFFTYAEPN